VVPVAMQMLPTLTTITMPVTRLYAVALLTLFATVASENTATRCMYNSLEGCQVFWDVGKGKAATGERCLSIHQESPFRTNSTLSTCIKAGYNATSGQCFVMYNQSCQKLFSSSGSRRPGEVWMGECSDAIKDYATPLNITTDTCSPANDSQKALNISTGGGNTLGGRPVSPEAPDATFASVAAGNSTGGSYGSSGRDASVASGSAGGAVDVGMIAGVAAGGLAALSAAIIAVWWLCRRRAAAAATAAATAQKQQHLDPKLTSTGLPVVMAVPIDTTGSHNGPLHSITIKEGSPMAHATTTRGSLTTSSTSGHTHGSPSLGRTLMNGHRAMVKLPSRKMT
jgi:hypothetical protein